MGNKLTKSETLLEAFSPMQMLKSHRHIKTIQDVVKTPSESLSGLCNLIDEDSVCALIELHLWKLNESMNLNNKLTEHQIIEISIEIVSNYYYLKMEDVFLIFRKAKLGHFGQLYSSLSMIDIFGWFDKYNVERTEYYIEMNTKDIHRDSSTRLSQKDSDAMHLARLMDFKNNLK